MFGHCCMVLDYCMCVVDRRDGILFALEIGAIRGANGECHAPDIPPPCRHDCPDHDAGRGARSRRVAVGRLDPEPFVVRHKCWDRACAAGPLQPPASRRRPGDRLPLLPHLGGEFVVRRDAAHQDVHELSFADVGGKRRARTGTAELSDRRAAQVAPRLQFARLRLLRSQHSRAERDRLPVPVMAESTRCRSPIKNRRC